ncbi:MAG: hypothetical protein WD533_04495 [Dehalococcoidia bacterium]
MSDETSDQQLPWLPGERFELALDARLGMSTSPMAGDNVLTVTTRRAIKLGSEPGKRTTSMLPLDRVAAVEVIDAERPTERLTQGLVVLGIGIIAGIVSWVFLEQQLITLLAGGLPVLVAIYMLAGYAFPDTEGELILHTGSYTLRQPLQTPESRRDAYLAAHRIYDLVAAPGLFEETAAAPAEETAETPAAASWPNYQPAPPREEPAPRLAAWPPPPTERNAGTAPNEPREPVRPYWARPQEPVEREPEVPRPQQSRAEEPESRWSAEWERQNGEPPARRRDAPSEDDAAHQSSGPRHYPSMAAEEEHREDFSPAAEHALEEDGEPSEASPPQRWQERDERDERPRQE